MLAGLATPLVISVHSIVSMDFATSVLPGWHTTIFPPYFVAGAVFSGFGMVMTLLIITRKVMHLQAYITLQHLDRMAKIMLFTGSLVAFSYATEFFAAWYGTEGIKIAAEREFHSLVSDPDSFVVKRLKAEVPNVQVVYPRTVADMRLRTAVGEITGQLVSAPR